MLGRACRALLGSPLLARCAAVECLAPEVTGRPALGLPLTCLRAFRSESVGFTTTAPLRAALQGAAVQLRGPRSLPLGSLSLPRGAPAAPPARSVATAKHKPKFTGGKMKLYSRYKGRFFMTGSGEIRSKRSGHSHKRFVKGPKRNRQLRQTRPVHSAYANLMKKLGFKSRTYC